MTFFGLWGKKEEQRSQPDQTLEARLARVETSMARLETEILDLTVSIKVMRDKVLRKIQFHKEQPEEGKEFKEQQPEQPQLKIFGGQIG